MKIPNRCFEKKTPQKTQRRIADPAILPWHRSRFDCTTTGRQAAAHDEVVPLPELFHKAPSLAKIVAIVGIAHDDPSAVRGLDSTAKRIAITFGRDANNAGTAFLSDLDRAVA